MPEETQLWFNLNWSHQDFFVKRRNLDQIFYPRIYIESYTFVDMLRQSLVRSASRSSPLRRALVLPPSARGVRTLPSFSLDGKTCVGMRIPHQVLPYQFSFQDSEDTW